MPKNKKHSGYEMRSVDKAPLWPMLLIGVGAVITVVWVGFLGVLTFRLLTMAISAAAEIVQHL